MKKLKFRQILVVVLILMSIITMVLILKTEHTRAIEDCVQGGNNRQWCENELSK